MSETAPQPVFRITMQPAGTVFAAPADQTLLLAGLAAGLGLPWSCRTGTCRTCIARVVQGQVEHRIPWPGLSYEEKAEGFILPCVAEARSDATITFGAWPASDRPA
ncbi:2Fe-2S iron-sulfur cluster-binding protein [Roseateles sp. LKC17W]|uniref:2Fe-2S iron-sulfur cluster-binding protein n=1 Tax=Pelomonas margarita TaxID=3299031 RepID=A0ABW7FGR5_9BURK